MRTFRILWSVTERNESRRVAALFAGLFVLLLCARLCHLHILWAEEGYGSAAAVQILHGKGLYRDFWFDKPPLAALIYLFWGGAPGWGLRFGAALYGLGCCVAAWRCAAALWTRREGWWAAVLTAFFLIFDLPAVVTTLAPDLLMVLPSLAAIESAVRRQPVRAGLWCSVALAANAKAALVLAVCLVWCEGAFAWLLAGFLAGCLPWAIWLTASGSLVDYWRQVWWFGGIYSRDTFVLHPVREGLLRTANWLGFHLALLLAAVFALREEPRLRQYRWLASFVLAGVGVIAGARFFPRYYFILFIPLVLVAARGIAGQRPRIRVAVLSFLLIPLIRFGPRYFRLASDLLAGRDHHWSDVALNQDSQRASAFIQTHRHLGDTLLVWGYRPDLFAYTGLPVAGKFLDSQLLTGVLADRHLTNSVATLSDLAAANRKLVPLSHPTWIVDGLGPINPVLAIERYPDLRDWLTQNYVLVFRDTTEVIYQDKQAAKVALAQ